MRKEWDYVFLFNRFHSLLNIQGMTSLKQFSWKITPKKGLLLLLRKPLFRNNSGNGQEISQSECESFSSKKAHSSLHPFLLLRFFFF